MLKKRYLLGVATLFVFSILAVKLNVVTSNLANIDFRDFFVYMHLLP